MNDKQTKVIHAQDRNIMLIAAAGSGKTTVLIHRIKNILKTQDPKKILAITFTKKAAIEMRERLNNTLVDVFTFDALCYYYVYDGNFSIYDEDIFPKEELLKFSLFDIKTSFPKPKGYDNYVRYKKTMKLKDFNDIDYMFLNKIGELNLNYTYIFIDEFQDTNDLQFEILKKLAKKDTHVFAVGDPDQSIYAFRGTKQSIINEYIKFFHATTYDLDMNYRSNEAIITSANNLIRHNKNRIKKKMVAYKKDKNIIGYLKFNNYLEESKMILKLIEKYPNLVILTRTHERAYTLKQQLILSNLNNKILTIHESKGLEFEVVILLGIDKNVMPKLIYYNELELEEERRLMFVGMTRAKSILIVTTLKASIFIKEAKLKPLNKRLIML